MWFLIKGSFWFTIVLVALSFFGVSGNDAKTSDAGTLDVADAVSAASGAYQYLAKICIEQPAVCEKGAETFSAVSARARDGALVAFQILDSHLNKDTGAKVAELDQPMPALPGAANATLVTGTVPQMATIPVPLAKPVRP
ncbi:DUF5330 domain-containing protein [Rhizobium halophytocola]|uniref:DUF5330 domain-containing protein n=1 Tax=Rhizobium halophytocola TaxID=735519 RepID=A0ABS4E5R4_9HYPH|nr:DUF5330 domain-containing protein [Rhizobium halophytocola]MBP1853290.1 hypothetical protein [Rhizobium halophytocola]